ncbi:uncharacterized protein LOC143039054 [Oratosquilla oratoria]|uniref:uncharacterized protein LOC143039054 n=1 Tax=Oratosquilla oratoria TaxID=337810 RepID=UPI003F75F62C
MRLCDEPYSATTVVTDKDGNPLCEEDSIKNRWQEYFKELLNPNNQGNTQSQFQPHYPEENELNILRSEIQHAFKTSPRNKAAGINGITKAILACGETGITWLTTIFQKAWMEKKVPEDWQRAVSTRYKVDPLLSEAQIGFKKGRGCTDAIFALRQLSKKTIQHNKELNLVFVDQEKAFD